MKKYILSPLCSAFVIPGLGQIINQDLKKGLIILGAVFALFVLGAIKLAFMIRSVMNLSGVEASQPGNITAGLPGEGFTVLWPLIVAFTVVWIYSVMDAFWAGKRLDREERGVSR